jgi:uncharacterized protein
MREDLQKVRYLEHILPKPNLRRLVLLTGARQTGKTTLARLKYPGLRYINLDAPENRESVRTISSASWAQAVGNAVIDEAQKEPVVFEKVKYAYDEGSLSFSCLLGSSQILLLKRIRESLAGRVSVYELWPLMMSELIGDRHSRPSGPPLIDRLFSEKDFSHIFKGIPEIIFEAEDLPSREAEDHLLRWGGMPALLPLSGDERWKWLRDYEYTYLERDLGDLARLDDLDPFRTFQRLSALRSGKLLNYSEIARDASLGVETARRYLEYLRLSYQTILLQPYKKNITSSVIKTPKLYWLDIGLLRVLSGWREGLPGEIYETMVVSEMMKWMKSVQRQEDLFFYRTRSGLEVDLLLPTSRGIIGMEIKARKTLAPTDIRAMTEVAGVLGKTWRGGVVIYLGDSLKKIADPHVWAIPSRRLFTPA